MKRNLALPTTHMGILFLTGILVLGGTAPAARASDATPQSAPEVISFSWRPKVAPPAAYRLEDPADQHKILIFPGVAKSGAPVILGFHGQPARGKNPRDYPFAGAVIRTVTQMVQKREIPPAVLVLPSFRFVGQNWPGFDTVDFKRKVTALLAEKKIVPGPWVVFGHSGAAGCGGEGGLNQAHRIHPKAVGFFDTCLGGGWRTEVRALKTAGIPTVHLHSVETAGFRPRQRPEYQTTFDFGRAWGPLGIRPVKCGETAPKVPLRNQPHRCSATPDGRIEGYVLDTGEGLAAHQALLPVALRYFLSRFLTR